MEKQITVKDEYNTLDNLLNFLKSESSFECSKDYDSWDVRTDSNGHMKKCVIVKKSGMHGIKVYFSKENVLKMNYIIPSKFLNAYFGKSQERRRSIFEVITGMIRQALLSGSQKKAFEEIEQVFNKIIA